MKSNRASILATLATIVASHFAVTTTVLLASDETTGKSIQSWEKPREISSFQELLKRSPFSLPTAEESSPLGDRYAMTGIITIDGEEQVFIFDRTDQSRSMIGKKPNEKNISLVSLIREGNDAPTKASIRVGGDTGTIGFMEAAQPKTGTPPAPGSPLAGVVPGAPPGVTMPALPPLPQQPSMQPPTRRIIRRPIVNAPQPAPRAQPINP
jgi:hypothetical protein